MNSQVLTIPLLKWKHLCSSEELCHGGRTKSWQRRLFGWRRNLCRILKVDYGQRLRKIRGKKLFPVRMCSNIWTKQRVCVLEATCAERDQNTQSLPCRDESMGCAVSKGMMWNSQLNGKWWIRVGSKTTSVWPLRQLRFHDSFKMKILL